MRRWIETRMVRLKKRIWKLIPKTGWWISKWAICDFQWGDGWWSRKVTTEEEPVLRGGWTEIRFWRYDDAFCNEWYWRGNQVDERRGRVVCHPHKNFVGKQGRSQDFYFGGLKPQAPSPPLPSPSLTSSPLLLPSPPLPLLRLGGLGSAVAPPAGPGGARPPKGIWWISG